MTFVSLSVAIIAGLVLVDLNVCAHQVPNLSEPPQLYFQKIPKFSFNKQSNEKPNPFSGFKPKLPIPDPQILNPFFSNNIRHTCPEGFIVAGEKCLWLNQSPLPWRSAQNFCNQYGLRLLELRSGNYYVDVVTALKSQNGGQGSYWVGASQRRGFWGWNSKYIHIPEAFWAVTFINGKPVKEPKDDRKHCAFLDDDRWYFLNADHCDSYKHFICEEIPVEQSTFNGGGGIYFETEDGGQETFSEESNGPVCKNGWTGYGESCYNVSENEEPYQEAERLCHEQNSTIVSLHDAEENNWVSELVSSVSTNATTLVWIGLVRDSKDKFEWGDGSTFNYSNWHDAEPNNVHHSENCVHLEVISGNKWRDEFCGSNHRFVCEKKATAE